MSMLLNSYRYAAAGGGWTPGDLPALHAWFKADSITGLADTDPVTAWLDSSGNGRTASAPSGEAPLYRTNILNGQPVVRFDASTSKRLATAAWTAISQPNTIFIVGSTRNADFSQLVDGIESGNRHAFYRHTSNTVSDLFAGSSGLYTVPAMSTNRIWTLTVNGASSRVRGDGGAGVAASVGSHTLTGLTIGNRFVNDNGAVDIAEVILCNSNLGTTDLNLAGNHLADKYALSWTDVT